MVDVLNYFNTNINIFRAFLGTNIIIGNTQQTN